MSLIRFFAVSVGGVLCIACASDNIAGPPRGFTHSAATFACGPADGAAVAIYLTRDPVSSIDPTTPFVRVYVTESVERLGGQKWIVGGANAKGGAVFRSSATSLEVATSGFMVVKSVSADKTVEGNVDISFPTAGHITGGFHAVWVQSMVLCG